MQSRRQFLKSSALVSIGAMTGLAGCSGIGGFGGGGSNPKDWFLDPLSFPNEPDYPLFLSTSPKSFDEHRDTFAQDPFENYQEGYVHRYEFTNSLYIDQIDTVVRGGSNGIGFMGSGFDVVMGEFDTETLKGDLRNEGLASRGEHKGYELFEMEVGENANRPWVAGVTDGTLIVAGAQTEDANPIRFTEDIINTKKGELERYHEFNSEFETLTKNTSFGDYTYLAQEEPAEETNPEQGTFRNHIGTSYNVTLEENESSVEQVLTFQLDYEPRKRALETWTNQDVFKRWRDRAITVETGMAKITGAIRTPDILEEIWTG